MTTNPALHHARLTAAEALLTATIPKLRPTFTTLAAAQPGYPTGSGTGTGTHTGEPSDRTGTLATTDQPDAAARDLDDLHTLCARVAHDIVAIADITRRWPSRPGAEWAKALRTEAAANLATTDRWCTTHEAVGSHEPPRRPGGRLCRWCEDLARDLGVTEPPLDLVDKRSRGMRITTADIDAALKRPKKKKRRKAKR